MTPDLVSGLLVLAGAVLGSVTTAIGMVHSARMERRRLAHEIRGRVNAQAIHTFSEYLTNCKTVERLAERREAGDNISDDDVRAATAPMWLSYQEVAVFCPSSIRESA